ncbi:hypothetical protein H6F67_06500 [Microcoleus sp. FACHB-1515]|uniref:hypothetical protein n=1 Tax=Cyanophyceae TaxID=3028117 RepID=UPI00168318CA|nr:hypothetical protein [Microcoleus sp. FACHB-1515]MBD2089502.1 hypothetical protein [Microcoleus sp. FACHB-1515]
MTQNNIDWWVDLTSILTFFITLAGAFVGIYGYLRYQCEFRQKNKRLENYLRREKEKGEDRGQRSVLRIMRDIGLTEDEMLKISFHNPKVSRRVGKDEFTGLASALLFEYVERS